MYSFFLLILFYHTTLALFYNDKCTKKCNFPGMICINNQCKCDSKNRLFWTGARCTPCPNDWTMTETVCMTLYETKMKWEVAKATCRSVQAELISFHNKNIIPLLYNVTSKGSFSGSPATMGAWTSAHATDLSGLGVYKWLDNSINPFDSNSDWWCRPTTQNLGYIYKYNEPTKFTRQNETEACVAYWRGTTNTQVVCLDDQFCSLEFVFICEKSESTAKQYLGPPPNILPDTSTVVGTNIQRTPNTMLKPKKSSTGIIIIIIAVVGALLLLALLGGIFCFLKRRNRTAIPFNNTTRNSKVTSSTLKKSDTNVNDTTIKNIDPIPAKVSINLPVQKNKRLGYSKQQFEEFE